MVGTPLDSAVVTADGGAARTLAEANERLLGEVGHRCLCGARTWLSRAMQPRHQRHDWPMLPVGRPACPTSPPGVGWCWSFGRLAVGAGSCQESPGRGRTTAAGDFRYDVLLAGLAAWLTAQDGQPAPE